MRVLLPAFMAGTSVAIAAPALAQESAESQGSADAESVGNNNGLRLTWDGVPELTAPGGWSVKPRGRLQLDSAVIDAPSGIPADGLGSAVEVRRAYLGVDGKLPGDFGFRLEVDFAPSAVELTDAYLTYEPNEKTTLTLGQHKPFFGLEELTSDLFTSMLERAAFNGAFNFGRRIGISGAYDSGDFLLQAGAFTANATDIDIDDDNSYSFDTRAVFKPEIGKGRLHVGGSAHFRELSDSATSVRYRARPFFHTTDTRLVDTGAIPATAERSFGAELAYIQGPFHATLEGHRITALRPGQSNPSFVGGYAEIGMLVTPGDTTAYKGGAYDRIRPVDPISKGGIGAIQINTRYDHIDLNDKDITGGRQQALGLSMIWIPEDHARLMFNYGHLWISNAVIPAGASVDYEVDTFGVRAQFDF